MYFCAVGSLILPHPVHEVQRRHWTEQHTITSCWGYS